MDSALFTGCIDGLSAKGAGTICKGRVYWNKSAGYWRGKCDRCETSTRAASGDAAALDDAVAKREAEALDG